MLGGWPDPGAVSVKASTVTWPGTGGGMVQRSTDGIFIRYEIVSNASEMADL